MITPNNQVNRVYTGVLNLSTERLLAIYCSIRSITASELITELDSHADPLVVGINTFILFRTGKTVRLSGFSKTRGILDQVPIVIDTVAYTDEISGVTYLIIINNKLYAKEMENNPIPLFMLRLAGHQVDEYPKYLSKNPITLTHNISVSNPFLIILLSWKGITSYISTRLPSKEERTSCEYINLTPNNTDWNRYSSNYTEQEACMLY